MLVLSPPATPYQALTLSEGQTKVRTKNQALSYSWDPSIHGAHFLMMKDNLNSHVSNYMKFSNGDTHTHTHTHTYKQTFKLRLLFFKKSKRTGWSGKDSQKRSCMSWDLNNKVSTMGKAEEECSVYTFKILLPISGLEPLENNLD